MNLFILLFITIFSTNAAFEENRFVAEENIHNNSNLKFISHNGEEAFGSYLTMQVNYGPVSKIWKELEKRLDTKIKNRGEAHITVITPVEFDRVLKKKITIGDINRIALEENIQSSSFAITCLGSFVLNIRGKNQATYFIVVESEDLLNIRKRIGMLYLERGGEKGLFDANDFYPHITVGFTKRDLHQSDGALKDKRSCFARVN